jgi:hypothetical protein
MIRYEADTFTVNKLISLVRFYGISHHQLLTPESVESDESDDSDGAVEARTLEEIVRSNPERAQEALAEKLGLNYAKISIFMERVKAFRQEAATGKRPAPKTHEEQLNKRRLPPPEGQRISSSPDVPPLERLPMELLLEPHQSSQETSHHSDRISWQVGPRSPGPIIKDAPQDQARQPAEADSPKLSLPSTALILSADRWFSRANPNTTPERSPRRDSKG